jgi:hypothetical protein
MADGFEVLSFTAGMPQADGPSVWLARRIGPERGIATVRPAS